ncbi:MAG: polyphosphate kinase 1 [Treponema sp.]|jgi:polyphosphate kinase|nr:polyphosphate kinase 1 [Treponema sp.]
MAETSSDTSPRSPVPPPLNFINRDLSWIDFNARVLEEGLRKDLPPLERFRFLSIVSSNLDEFFMVRVAAIKRAIRAAGGDRSGHGPAEAAAGIGADPSGLDLTDLLGRCAEKIRLIIDQQYRCLEEEVFPALGKGGLVLARPGDWTPEQRDYLEFFFMNDIYPVLTPLRVEAEGPLPSIGGFSLNCAFLLEAAGASPLGISGPAAEYTAIVQIPPALNRIILLPGDGDGVSRWALLEDLALNWGGRFFPGMDVKERLFFKVNRDADFSVDERRDEDFIEAMEEVLEDRERSMAVRMVCSPGSEKLRDRFARRLGLGKEDIYEMAGPVHLGELADLANLPGFDHLREKPWPVFPGLSLGEEDSLWDRIRAGDILLHLPYQSFDPVTRFFQDAAADPRVVSIKATLYRTSGNSPIVRALEQAGLSGKQVTVLVELKARFDEERNISWANRLEKAGVIVIYGLARLKVHVKISLVTRREDERIRRYVHLSTGNYNDRTARFYEDLSLFTAREEIAYDAGILFNMITGYSAIQPMRRLYIAPSALKRRLLELIDREIKRSSPENPGRIMAKLNALADPDMVKALYRASQAGVRVLLCVRGICSLVPGVKDLSENIRVISVIDRYLEHSRIFSFANGGMEEIYLSSADWLPRNLERRVELMFPVLDEGMSRKLHGILESYFHDNCQARLLGPDGVWTRLSPRKGEETFRVQARFFAQAANGANGARRVRQEFIVRRSPGNP